MHAPTLEAERGQCRAPQVRSDPQSHQRSAVFAAKDLDLGRMAGHGVVQLGGEVGRQQDISARLAVLEARLTAVNDQLTHPQPTPLEIDIAQFKPVDLAAPQPRIVATTTEIGECLA